MNGAIVNWLRNKFTVVPEVKFATDRPEANLTFQFHDADLTVETWMGTRVHVYILQDAPKLRDIRNILKENSRRGIGTLYLVDHALLPQHGDIIKVQDWQEALLVMNDQYIYSYRLTADGISIVQANFLPTNLEWHYEVWNFQDFQIEHLAVRKRSLQSNLRGDWYIADMVSSAYKRRINYERVNERHHYRTRNKQEIRRPANSELKPCYAMLQVSDNASEADVKMAYRRMAIQLHPDVSALPKIESERRFKEINQAYQRIKEHHGWS